MSTKADIWMPLYIGDYLRDTTRLTTAQHGAYLLLIMDYWTNGAPPDDDEVLASITKSSAEEWQKLKPTIIAKFNVEDGVWRHNRIEREIDEATKNKQKRVERSLKANLAKASKATLKESSKDTSKDTVEVTPSPSPSPSPTSIPTSSSSTKKKTRNVVFDRPEDVTETVWDGFLQIRKAKSAPVTEAAITKIRKEAAKIGYSLDAALEMCCARGWAGFEADWVSAKTRKDNAMDFLLGRIDAQGNRIVEPAPWDVIDEPKRIL